MGRRAWSEVEIKKLKDVVQQVSEKFPGISKAEACRIISRTGAFEGRSLKALYEKIGDLGLNPSEVGAGADVMIEISESETFQTKTEIQGLKDEVNQLRRLLREASREHISMQDVMDSIHDLIPTLKPPPFISRAADVQEDTAVESGVLSFGDWHFGEIVSPEATRGWSQYNADIAAKRVAQVVRNVIKIKDRLERGNAYYFPELVIPVGGDMTGGMQHGGDNIEYLGNFNIVKMALGAAMLLAEAIRELSAHFPEVHVVCIVGNHGRLHRKKQYKEPDRSFDWLVYQVAAVALQEIQNVYFFSPCSHSTMMEVRDWKFFITHGDEFKAHFSMPYYSIDRKVGRTLALESTRGNAFHYSLIYHWHESAKTPLPGGKNRVMPSLKGGDEYVLERLGVNSMPSQWFAGVHRKYGVTHEWDIHAHMLDDDIQGYTYAPWLETSAPDAKPGVPIIYKVKGLDPGNK